MKRGERRLEIIHRKPKSQMTIVMENTAAKKRHKAQK